MIETQKCDERLPVYPYAQIDQGKMKEDAHKMPRILANFK